VVKKVLRFTLRLALAAAVAWLARLALKRWIEGPAVPAATPWPPIPDPSPKPPPPETAAAPQTSLTPETHSAPAAEVWVKALEDGSNPPTHPVKAKVSSHIYHLPGMAFYGRTRADRCYATAEAAEADGFVKAKR
jgi:hypothetical protein